MHLWNDGKHGMATPCTTCSTTHMHLNLRLALPAFLATLATATAQDLIGVGWSGQVVLVDSMTAAVTPLGFGLPGQNGLARDASGTYWCTTRTTASPFVYGLTQIDPATGTATVIHTPTVDLRGSCQDFGTGLFAIQDGGPDRLVQVDVTTGVITTIGNTGYSSIQGLALHLGVLYAWDLNQGLLIVNPATGLASDPFPGLGGPTGVQFLCSHPDGRLLVGGGSTTNSLYVVDTATGLTTLIGVMSGAADLRGLEVLGGFATPFGTPCLGVGGPVHLRVTGNFSAGGTLVATSNNHAPNTLGAIVFGISTTSHIGIPLPADLTPFVGTVGCTLYTSIDATLFSVTSAGPNATLDFRFTLGPAAAGAIFHVQHACFDPVPGGMSWSNAASLHIAR